MKRKIHSIGGYSYYILIPPKWIKENKIKEEINLVLQKDKVILNAIEETR